MNKKKNVNKKLNIKNIIILLFIIIFIIYLFFISNLPKKENILNNLDYSNIDSFGYSILKQDNNANYLGIGQEKVYNKDGYFTTFTTKNNKIYKEYKQNGNSSWSNYSYWDNIMATDGCSITAISIILSAYNKNYTPGDLREKYYPVLNGDNISYELDKTFGIYNSDFFL